VLRKPSDSQSHSIALKGEQTSTAVAISPDGKHVLVARGHPAPNLEVYCCKSVRHPLASRSPTTCMVILIQIVVVSMLLSLPLLQMNLITESPLEQLLVTLDVNPLDTQQAISTSLSAVHLHSIITSTGNKHLLKRSVTIPNSSATCHAFFPRVIYLGTADGNLLCYNFQATLLQDVKGNCTSLPWYSCMLTMLHLDASPVLFRYWSMTCSRGPEV
jgi:hypothetical protein